MLFQICFILLIPFFFITLILKLSQVFQWRWLEKTLSKLDNILVRQRPTKQSLFLFEGCLVLLILVFALSVSINLKPTSWWKQGCITVIADSTDWQATGDILKDTFERVTYTPQPERVFTLKYVSINNFKKYSKYRFLIFISTSLSSEKIAKVFDNKTRSVLENHTSKEEDSNTMFILRDQWSRKQLSIFILAENTQTMVEEIRIKKETLYDLIKNAYYDHLQQDMFLSLHEKRTSEKLMESYGWTFKKHPGLLVHQECPDEGFISFHSWSPKQWMFVRWIDGADKSLLVPDWITKERNRIGASYFDGMCISEYYLNSHPSTFQGHPARVTTGLWELNHPTKGGPFKNYTVFDSTSQRLYIIDFAVLNPGKPKLPILNRLDAIAHTFSARH